MENKTSSVTVVLRTMTAVFVVQKLAGVIPWNWFWVLSPILIPFIVGLVIYAVAEIFGVIVWVWPPLPSGR